MNSCTPLCSQPLASLPAFPLCLGVLLLGILLPRRLPLAVPAPEPRHPPAAPMLSTESFTGARALGEESLQMWDLNKRLEAYLARVKFLEEENEVLRAEIQSTKSSPAGDSWRVKYEEELRALRDALDHAFREKCMAELARDNLYEEVQQVKSRCQKEQAAREEAKKQLSLSRKELEEEKRAQIWLKERAVQLKKEVEVLLEVHEEEKAGLDQEIASFSHSLESFRCAPVAFQPVEVEDYSKRLSEIWKGAVETYKTEVSQLEGSLCQAKENLWKAVEDNQQSQMQLQHLEKDLAGLKARKEMLEESLAQQWQEQRGEAEKFQLAMEALEQEQQSLRVQIARVLEDRQQLMHLKMSLSLEVATYRTLLEAESTRLQMPAGEFRLANGVRDLKLEVSSSSSSKLVPASPEIRRLLPRDQCTSPSIFPRAEGRGQLAKPQRDTLTAKSQSPSARELQKISSVLHGTSLPVPGRAGELEAPVRPTFSPTQAGKAPSPLSPEPSSPSLPEQESSGTEGPAWPGGDRAVTSQGTECPLSRATEDTPSDSVQPLGAAPTLRLQYPAQLVSEALEDALKAMEGDAQPKEEPTLSATWAPRDACVPSPIFPTEACGEAVSEGPGEEQEPSEGSEDGVGPEAEERLGEVMLQGLGVESSILQDRAVFPPGMAASLSASGSQEDLGTWEEEEEEIPAVLSPRDPGVEAQEGDRGLPGQTVTSWEKPEQEEDRAETPSTEPSHPSEDEEERGPCSPCKENGDFQEEGTDVQEEERPHGVVEAAHAVLAESHLALPTKGHLEEDFVDAEQERSEQQKMPMCEMDLAAEKESGQELCPEQKASSIHEAIPEEEPSLAAEEDSVGGKDTGRVKDGEGEKGEASREVLGGEDHGVGEDPEAGEDPTAGEDSESGEDRGAREGSEAGEHPGPREDPMAGEDPEAGEAVGGDTLEWESRAPEEPEDLQENGSVEEEGEQEELEPREEPWGRGDDGNGQEPYSEDWEVTEGDLGPEEPAWADDTQSSAGGQKGEETDGTLPAEPEGAQEDDEEDTKSQEMSQQQALPEAEPAPKLARLEQQGTMAEPEPAPPGAPEQGDTQELAEAPEQPWEVQDENADDELSSELAKQESSELVAMKQVPGDSAESGEWALEEVPRDPEPTAGSGRRVELEDTLPDSTPLHLYEGELLAVGAPSPNPPETEETTETAPVSDTAQEGEGGLEGSNKPPTPTMPESPEEEAGAEVAAVAEGAEEEEGYFMVSAPNQEVSSLEEAEISEDFEEIKIEAAEGSQDDLGAPEETSPVAENKAHLEVLVAEADGDTEMPTEEPEVPKDEDNTGELEEGAAGPEADPSCLGAMGPLAGGTNDPAQGATGTGAWEGPEHLEGLAAESDEELHNTTELERHASGATTVPGCSLGLAGQEEEEEGADEDEPSMVLHDTAKATPPAGLQAQAVPDEAEQPLEEQPVMEEEALNSDSPSSPRNEQPPEANPPQPGSALGQGGFPEVVPDIPDTDVLSAEVPVDIMKDSDILEIVEQALEFNQELMGVRVAEGGQQGPGRTELPQDAGEDSSPASSSEEEPTVQEAPDVGPEMEGLVRAENGLHRDASLEDLAEFTEEVLNGIASTAPAQELSTETTDTPVVMPPQAPTPGDGTATKLEDATLRGKHGGADPSPVPPALGEDVLCLTPDQPPACQLRAEQEPWSSGDE
ncbi:nestin [Sylvia atricapilla]|uniref:nestin n=1 Tax=Sylvia atricapilla TaxID=48155 RepID=UPI0033960F43